MLARCQLKPPKYVKWLPFGSYGMATPWGQVYVREALKERASVHLNALLAHEYTHIEQLERNGRWRHSFKYVFSGSGR